MAGMERGYRVWGLGLDYKKYMHADVPHISHQPCCNLSQQQQPALSHSHVTHTRPRHKQAGR